MNYIKIFLSSLLVVLFFYSCNDDTSSPPPQEPHVKDTLAVSLRDAAYRSISLNIHTVPLDTISSVRLYRIENTEKILVSEYSSAVKDTFIVDDDNGDGLLLNTSFLYFAVMADTAGNEHDSSNILQAATMDTTSQNYTFQETLIGEAGSSLNDIWGSNGNNIWAIGNIRINDKSYGAIHWTGSEWLPDSTVSGNAIFGFNENDVWTAGTGLYHYDGSVWAKKGETDSILIANAPYNCIWGASSFSIYLGCNNGKIIRWDGSKAAVLYSDNNIPLKDIRGYTDNFILACGNQGTSEVLIKYENNSWSKTAGESFNSVYIVSPKDYYGVGRQIKRYRYGLWSVVSFDVYGYNKIRGNVTSGELGIAADLSTVYIYNGIRWTRLEITLAGTPPPLNSIYLYGNKLYAVGSFGDKARIVTGTRN